MASFSAIWPPMSRALRRHDLSHSGGNVAATFSFHCFSTSPAPQRAAWRLADQQQQQHRRGISTSAPLEKRKTRDSSKLRGVSTIHRSGPKEPLSVTGVGIPEPYLGEDAGRMTDADNDPDHGLWGFFYDKKLLPNPEHVQNYGRAWTVQELRGKSWGDLHALWWVCCRERNRISTVDTAREKLEIGFGALELRRRDRVVRQTMKAIKHVLTERYYTWEDAVKIAKEDPEVDLSGNGPVYTPSTYLEDEINSSTDTVAAETSEPETAPEAKPVPPEKAATIDLSNIPSSSQKPETAATRP